MNREITIIGIDCAVDPKNVGLALGTWHDGKVALCESIRVRMREDLVNTIAEWIDGADENALLAMDAPLGWPRDLGRQLAEHQAGEFLSGESNQLFRRYTDHEIRRRLRKQPLDVGADRIARTAYAALRLLVELRSRTGKDISLAWDPSDLPEASAIEVYPAGTLKAHGIDATGYKKKSGKGKRLEIIGQVSVMIEIPERVVPALAETDDALDAALCVLAGADFLNSRAVGPGTGNFELARKEGWIWC